MKSNEEPLKALSSVMQWLSSPRGGDNFYGRVMNGCGRSVNRTIQTAAVTLTRDGKYLFLWHPEWFIGLKMPERILTVIHEAGHIVLRHLERFLRLKLATKDHETFMRFLGVMNLAADMASNDVTLRGFADTSTFAEHKKMFIFPESEQYKFPTGKSFEEYLQLLIEKAKKEGHDISSGKGDKPDWLKNVDNFVNPTHIPWWVDLSDLTDAEMETLYQKSKRESKKIVKKAVEQTAKQHGSLPGSVQNLIDEMLAEPQIPWEVMLRNLLRGSISSKLAESTAWPNVGLMTDEARQSGLEPYPGYQKDFGFHIAVAVDTSGSVSDEDFLKFMGEIKGIMHTEKAVSIQMMMFDCGIQHEFLLESDQDVQNECRSRYGYGGTSFIAPLQRVLRLDETAWESPEVERITKHVPAPDLVVMFTDGYAPVHENEGGPIPKYLPPCPLMWVITSGGQIHDAMGSWVVKMEE